MSDTNTGWLGAGLDALTGLAKGAAAGSVVPGLGTIGGGLIGLATALVPHIFKPSAAPLLRAAAEVVTGKANEGDQLAELAANPAATEAFRLEVYRIAQDERAAERAADQARMDAALADVADARKLTTALASTGTKMAWAAPVVSVVIAVGFFSALALLAIKGQIADAGVSAMVNMMVGGLVAGFTQVTSFWVGSSAGSLAKTGIIANLLPPTVPSRPAAAVVLATDVAVVSAAGNKP